MMRLELLVAMVSVVALGAACAESSGPRAGVARAGADVAAAPPVDRSVECPGLTRVKYPFLRCVRDEAGNVVFDAAPQPMVASQMPPLDVFVESDGYWGD